MSIKNIGVLFERLDIINAHESWLLGQGDIYMKYSVMDGNTYLARNNRLPGLIGEWKIAEGASANLHLSRLDYVVKNSLRILVDVFDADLWPNADDRIQPPMNVSYSSPGFGEGTHTFEPSGCEYKLTYTIYIL